MDEDNMMDGLSGFLQFLQHAMGGGKAGLLPMDLGEVGVETKEEEKAVKEVIKAGLDRLQGTSIDTGERQRVAEVEDPIIKHIFLRGAHEHLINASDYLGYVAGMTPGFIPDAKLLNETLKTWFETVDGAIHTSLDELKPAIDRRKEEGFCPWGTKEWHTQVSPIHHEATDLSPQQAMTAEELLRSVFADDDVA